MPVYPPKSSGAPSYAPGGLKNNYDSENCVYNWKASNTRILQQGLANAKAGGNTTHLVMGDSTSDGGYTGQPAPTYDRLRAWPVAMRDALALSGVPETGNGGVKICDGGLLDSRWTTSGSWTLTSLYFATSSTVGNTATFTAERSASVVEIWYYDGFTANFTVTVAGAVVGTVVPGGTAVWMRRRFTGLSVVVGTTVVVTITVAGTGLVLAGVKTFTPGGGFILDNLAQSASTATGTGGGSWLDTTVASGLGGAYQNLSGRTRQVTDGVTTAASAAFSSSTAAFTLQDVGEPIDFPPPASGAGAPFPANAYIAAYVSATQVTMSVPAVVTATAITANISRDPACIHIALGINDMASQSAATITAAITTIRNRFSKSDCILHLQHEQNYTSVSQATQQLFQAAMYSLADTLDVPLYDWRDRVGPLATGWANGAYGDYALHLTPATSVMLGSYLADSMVGGSAHPQANTTPVYDTDLTQKSYVDARVATAVAAAPTQQTGFRNILHNGAMQVAQRGTSASGSTASYRLVDRWLHVFVGGGGCSAIQDATSPPVGFQHSLKATVSTAVTTFAAGDTYEIVQGLEGLDVERLGWGVANGKTVTLSFWIKTSITGTLPVFLRGSSGTFSYVSPVVITAANTWQFVTVVVPPTASAIFTAYTATQQLSVGITLGAGTTFTTGTPNAWVSGAFISSTGATNFMGTVGNTIAITGVQLEVGSVPTPFEWRPMETELALCQRYFAAFSSSGLTTGLVSSVGLGTATTTALIPFVFKVPMIGAPGSIVTLPAATNFSLSDRVAAAIAATAIALATAGTTANIGEVTVTVASGLTASKSYALIGTNAGSIIGFSSEI